MPQHENAGSVSYRAESQRFSIRAVLLFLVCACIVPAILMVAGLVVHNFILQRDEAYAKAGLISHNVASDLDTDVARVEAGLHVLASAPELQRGDLASFYRRASEALGFQGVFAYVLTNEFGQQLLNTSRPHGQAMFANMQLPSLDQLLKGTSTAVTGVFREPLTNDLAVAVGVPVRVGTVDAILSAEVDIDRLGKSVRRQILPPGWIAAVIDSDGTILARTQDADRFVGQPTTPEFHEAIKRSTHGAMESATKDGRSVLTAFARGAKSGWTVAVGAPKAELMGTLYLSLAGLLVAGSFFIGLGLWMASRSARLLTQSVRDLIGPALALGSGRPLDIQPTRLQEAWAVGEALSQASRMLANAEHRAHHDALTGLCNRALFDRVAAEMISTAKRERRSLAVLLIDLDGFKAVNDTHGHAAGDLVLKIAAERICSHTRGADIRARLGGDEFAVLLNDTSAADARLVGDKLLRALSDPYPDVMPPISASIGVSMFPMPDASVESMVERADQALYSAKRQGKNVLSIALPDLPTSGSN